MTKARNSKRGATSRVAALIAAMTGMSPHTVKPRPMRIKADKYAPCPCGSGKKHKFCCFKPGPSS